MRIMSVDYGDVRTGLAICDESEKLASPVTVIKESYQPKLIEKIKAVISEQKPQELVVGFPRNMDGTEGERARKCSDFAKKLGESAALPVHLWDERMTTVSAHSVLNVTDTRGKKRKNVIDAVAATIILQDFINFRKNNK